MDTNGKAEKGTRSAGAERPSLAGSFIAEVYSQLCEIFFVLRHVIAP